jgi:hypothetical protein
MIPVNELRDRLAEVPNDKPVMTICRSGKRSVLAFICIGYHVEADGSRFAYCTDVEMTLESLRTDVGDVLAGVDALVLDAQYTRDEYEGRVGPPKKGWGHSTNVDAARIVGLHALHRVVFSNWNVLHSRCVDDVFNVFHGGFEALAVAHIADEVANGVVFRMRKILRHLILLLFIAREDDQTFNAWPAFQYVFCKVCTQRSCAAGDEHTLSVEVEHEGLNFCVAQM